MRHPIILIPTRADKEKPNSSIGSKLMAKTYSIATANCLSTDVGGMLFMLVVFKTSTEGIASKSCRETISSINPFNFK